jgi:hypothetical protein
MEPISFVSEGTMKRNDECGKMIVVVELFKWVLYKDQRK